MHYFIYILLHSKRQNYSGMSDFRLECTWLYPSRSHRKTCNVIPEQPIELFCTASLMSIIYLFIYLFIYFFAKDWLFGIDVIHFE